MTPAAQKDENGLNDGGKKKLITWDMLRMLVISITEYMNS